VLPQLQLQPELTKVLDCNLPTPNATVTVTASEQLRMPILLFQVQLKYYREQLVVFLQV
jgi:hypothetical protein